MTGGGKNDDNKRLPESSSASAGGHHQPGESTGRGADRDVRVILDEMLESIRLVHNYLDGITYARFESDQLLQDAVILRIAILGEAANHLPSEDKSPMVRNSLAHLGRYAQSVDPRLLRRAP